MLVFKTYFKILKTQIPSILIYAVIFIGLTILMTATQINNDEQQFQLRKVSVMVVNNDNESEIVNGLLNYLEDYVVYKPTLESEEARRDALFHNQVSYILTIPSGFTEAFLAGNSISLQKQLIPESVGAMSIDRIINVYLNTAQLFLKHNPDLTLDEINSAIGQSLRTEAKVSFPPTQKEDLADVNQFNQVYFNFLAYVIISCIIIGVSTVMLAFYGVDIRRRHQASPITNKELNRQLIFGNFLFVIAYMVIFVAVGYLLNGSRRLDTYTLLHWLNAFVFAITVLSISYLIGITMKNRRAISAASTIISLGLAFISGVFVPQEFLAEPVLRAASFTPTFWYVKANNVIANLTSFHWDTLSEVFGFMAIQLGFAAAIISIALVVSKRRTQQAY